MLWFSFFLKVDPYYFSPVQCELLPLKLAFGSLFLTMFVGGLTLDYWTDLWFFHQTLQFLLTLAFARQVNCTYFTCDSMFALVPLLCIFLLPASLCRVLSLSRRLKESENELKWTASGPFFADEHR